MNWQQVCEDPTLQDLPYKIELNEYGKIIMSPADTEHSDIQAEIAGKLLVMKTEGRVSTEQAIETSRGVKVPDVAWRSEAFLDLYGRQSPLPQAPEVCVEVVSPSNSPQEMDEKMRVYFESGAKEVWFWKRGKMSFYATSGEIERSNLFPEFPRKIN